MAGEAKSIGDLIVTIRSEGDEEKIRSDDMIGSVDNLTEVVKSFGHFIMVQSVVLDRFVKQSDNHIKELIEDIRRANEENRVRSEERSQSGDASDPTPQLGSDDVKKKSSIFSGILGGLFGGLGKLASGIFSPIINTLTSVFSIIGTPLSAIGRMFMRAGPVGAVIFGMYEIFKDITENPVFAETMESIRTVFNDRIVPTFNRIVESISSLVGPGTMLGDWFNGFRIQIQDFVLQTLGNLTNTVAGVLEGIGLLLNGEWSAGISSIVSSIFSGIYNLFDSAMTNILEMFGVNFGEGGSLFQFIGESIASLANSIMQTWDTIKTLILDAWNGFVSVLMNTIRGLFSTLAESVNNVFTAFQEGGVLSGVMTAMLEYFSLMVTKPLDLIKDLAAWVAEQFGFEKAAEWLSSFSLDETFRSFGDWIASIPQKLIDFAEEMWIDLWAKFKKGLVSLGAWIASIPDRIYLNAIDYLNNTSGVGYLIDDDAVAEAQRAVRERESGTTETLRQIELDAENQRRSLAERQAARVAENAVAATAGGSAVAPVYAPTSVNTGGNVTNAPTTYNTVINPHTGLDSPPYLLGGR